MTGVELYEPQYKKSRLLLPGFCMDALNYLANPVKISKFFVSLPRYANR